MSCTAANQQGEPEVIQFLFLLDLLNSQVTDCEQASDNNYANNQ